MTNKPAEFANPWAEMLLTGQVRADAGRVVQIMPGNGLAKLEAGNDPQLITAAKLAAEWKNNGGGE